MHLPPVEFVARGSAVGTSAVFHTKHRVAVVVNRIERLDIVRTRNKITIIAKEVYLWIVDIGVARRERCGIVPRSCCCGTQPHVAVGVDGILCIRVRPERK